VTKDDHSEASDTLDLMIRGDYNKERTSNRIIAELVLVIAHMEERLRFLEDWRESKRRSL
jgi:hypothetical protein